VANRRAVKDPNDKGPARRNRKAKDNGRAKPSRRPKVVSTTAPVPDSRADLEKAAESLPLPKTKLAIEEIDAFKSLLLEKRRQVVGDVGNMEAEALKKNRSDAAGDLSMMPIHMADIGTDNYEQEFTIGLIENEQEILKEIDAALGRIQNGSYGICEATRKPIKKARLKAKPWARFCVAYKRSQEENGRR
jgi:RNA polymerase-binding transcription factor DksA